MALKMDIKLDRRFENQARGRIERFYFDVGVLENKPHKLALSQKRGLKTLAGGPSRKVSQKNSGMTLQDVSRELRANTRINFYTQPFRSKRNQDLLRFIRAFMRLLGLQGVIREKKRVENALQAVVRNPIVRGDYGRNKKVTANIKGFNRLMIDTGQLFKGIVAKVRLRRVS